MTINSNTNSGQNADKRGGETVLFGPDSVDEYSHAFKVQTKARVVVASGLPSDAQLLFEVSPDNVNWFPWRVFGQGVRLTQDHTMVVMCVQGWYRLRYIGDGEPGGFECRTWEYSFEFDVCGYVPVVNPIAGLNIFGGDNVVVTENPQYNFEVEVPILSGSAPGLTNAESLPTPVYGSRSALLGTPARWGIIVSEGQTFRVPLYNEPA